MVFVYHFILCAIEKERTERARSAFYRTFFFLVGGNFKVNAITLLTFMIKYTHQVEKV